MARRNRHHTVIGADTNTHISKARLVAALTEKRALAIEHDAREFERYARALQKWCIDKLETFKLGIEIGRQEDSAQFRDWWRNNQQLNKRPPAAPEALAPAFDGALQRIAMDSRESFTLAPDAGWMRMAMWEPTPIIEFDEDWD